MNQQLRRGSVALAGVLAMACGTAEDPVPARRPDGGVPLPGVALPLSEAPALLTACDGTRTAADSLWTPADSLLRRLEARLSDHLREISPTPEADPLQDYARQYLGLYRDGRPIIFINGVNEQYLRRAAGRHRARGLPSRTVDAAERFKGWAVSVCDGGRGFFRAEYDVGSHAIARFAFNEAV